MKYTKEEIERVRAIPIESALGYAVRGRAYNIRCPFPDHQDNTASCSIGKENNGYICYGCDKRGFGLIDFLEDMGFKFDDIMSEYLNK